ncbi:MAG: hypothetical protein ACK5BN_08935, partial [Planctomycetota bacterium]
MRFELPQRLAVETHRRAATRGAAQEALGQRRDVGDAAAGAGVRGAEQLSRIHNGRCRRAAPRGGLGGRR